MCTLAIYFRQSENLPLVIAANRDEFYVRPTTEPRTLSVEPWVFGGQDLHGGGTWLGLNQHGMVVGLLNRRSPDGPDPDRRSRGLLCLEALQQPDPSLAAVWLRTLMASDYNGFNLLTANRERALVAVNDGTTLAIHELEPGTHVLTNGDVNDPTCPRIARSHRLFAQIDVDRGDPAALLPALRTILADHQPDEPGRELDGALCVHTKVYGTRSSTIITASRSARLNYWHASGPPCETPYLEMQLPSAVPCRS